jgi:hypothetical protein
MNLEQEALAEFFIESSYQSDQSHLIFDSVPMWDCERHIYFHLCPQMGVVINEENKIKEEY